MTFEVRSYRVGVEIEIKTFTVTISFLAVYCTSKLDIQTTQPEYTFRIDSTSDLSVALVVKHTDCRYTATFLIDPPTSFIETSQPTFAFIEDDPATREYVNKYKKIDPKEAVFVVK